MLVSSSFAIVILFVIRTYVRRVVEGFARKNLFFAVYEIPRRLRSLGMTDSRFVI